MKNQLDNKSISDLLHIMSELRAPDGGCPWDLEQTFATIAPYTLEEAYEVADAIARENMPDLRDELGDLLFQVVYHARMAEEAGAFDFSDVVSGICKKMTRRHPHVFGDTEIADADAQTEAWETLKSEENDAGGILDGVPLPLPALTRALKLGRRAARVGFDWPDADGPRAKVEEELGELDEAIDSARDEDIAAEMGDVFFALVNLCRHLGIDPEDCARGANARFEKRFRDVERAVEAGERDWSGYDIQELEALWLAAKRNP